MWKPVMNALGAPNSVETYEKFGIRDGFDPCVWIRGRCIKLKCEHRTLRMFRSNAACLSCQRTKIRILRAGGGRETIIHIEVKEDLSNERSEVF